MAKSWEETIMFPDNSHTYTEKNIREQAKAAWEARDKEIEVARKDGMQKVVDWVKTHSSINQGKNEEGRLSWFVRDEWQAFLKEHGLEEPK